MNRSKIKFLLIIVGCLMFISLACEKPPELLKGWPVANAGRNKAVSEGGEVHLDGSKSYDPDGKPLKFRWFCLLPCFPDCHPKGKLLNTDTAKPTFRAFEVSETTTIKIMLVVTDSEGFVAVDFVEVTILNREELI